MQPNEDATAVVLAGGASRRFDAGPKALAPVAGRPMLDQVVETAAHVTDATPVVAVATDDQRERFSAALTRDVRFVRDAADRDGPLAGLASALSSVDAAWILVLACDLPLVESVALRWLADRADPDVSAVVPRTEDGLHPLHAWYRTDGLAEALATEPETTSVHAFLDKLTVRTVSSSDAPEDVDLSRSVRNVNTVAELERVRRVVDDRDGTDG